MVQRIKKIVKKLHKDIRQLSVTLLVIAVYLLVTTVIFGTSCPYKIFTGKDCPGCGLTRGSLCILTGHFKRAAEYNITSYGWVALILWLLWERYFADKEKIRWEAPVIVLGVLTIIMYIIKQVYEGGKLL